MRAQVVKALFLGILCSWFLVAALWISANQQQQKQGRISSAQNAFATKLPEVRAADNGNANANGNLAKIVKTVASVAVQAPVPVTAAPTAAAAPAPKEIPKPLPTTIAPVPTPVATQAATAPVSSIKIDVNVPRDIAIVVLAFNRPDNLEKTLNGLFGLAEINRFTVYVSQDGDDPNVRSKVQQMQRDHSISYWHHPHVAGAIVDEPVYHVAQHYKFAMDQVFESGTHTHAILLEDDLVPAPDFLRMFESLVPYLDADPTLWCISSWNDNGFNHLTLDKSKFFRTGYFPGLGWMLRKELWLELKPKFPQEAWDHWMRMDGNSKNRECLVPEVSRNRNIGASGATVNQQEYDKLLANIATNTDGSVDYGDLSYLLHDNYAAQFQTEINAATPGAGSGQVGSFRQIVPRDQYPAVAQALGILQQPRGWHKHTLRVKIGQSIVFIIDPRLSPYVPASDKISQNPNYKVVAGAGGQNCNDVCARNGQRCLGDHFDWITCADLATLFPCEKGCDFNVGPDIPNYVSDPSNQRHYGKCLLTDAFPTCQASHPTTSRACPCG